MAQIQVDQTERLISGYQFIGREVLEMTKVDGTKFIHEGVKRVDQFGKDVLVMFSYDRECIRYRNIEA